MGLCLSAQVKAESPYHSGFIDMDESAYASETDSLSSMCKASLSFLVTPDLGSDCKMLEASNLKSFSLAVLKLATRNFRRENVLGEVGSGSVFKGWVDEENLASCKSKAGMAVAVKRMKHENLQSDTEWLAEVNFLGQLHHPNLVKLVGYCIEDAGVSLPQEERLLVNEFAARGSLENHLFRRGSYFQPLTWNLRLKVALGAAKGLAYLHSPEAKTVYRNFKASNILIDLNYNAKLTDFGWGKDRDESSNAGIIDTVGYAAPESKATGHFSAKSNVYSFGVVLLEMLSGRRAVDRNRPRNEINLVEWATPYLPEKVIRVLDNRLEGQYKIEAAQKVATLALLCLSIKLKFRPTMEQVVKVLEKLHDPNETLPAHIKQTRRRSRDISA